MKQTAKEYALLTLGAAIVAVGTYFFKFPNHFSVGGVTGLAVVLGQVFPNVSTATFNTAINVVFLIAGFLVLNRGFGIRTVYCTLMISGMVQLLEWVVPMSGPFTDETLLELFFAVLIPAVGTAILFNLEASSGGTDIAAMILKKYISLDTGVALLYSDVAIAASALLVFDVATGLFSLLGLVLKSVLIDSLIDSLNRRKALTIITSQPELVCDYITHTLNRGATVWEGQGAYTHHKHWIILAALSRPQAVALRRYLKQNDPEAFLLSSNTSEVFGKGFLQP